MKKHPIYPYLISECGEVKRLQIYSKFETKILKPFWSGRYLRVKIYDENSVKYEQIAIHVLVLETYVGERPRGLFGLHRDDDRSNNRLENLYWGSRKENAIDSIRNGKQVSGFCHPNLYIKRNQVKDIRLKYLNHMSSRKKAKNGFINSLCDLYPELTYKCVYKAATGFYDEMV